MDQKLFAQFKRDMRALLQSAGHHGLTLAEVERDYADVFPDQGSLPFARFGFGSSEELLANIPDVIMAIPARENVPILYYPISDDTTRHLEALIDRQRLHAPTRFGGRVEEETEQQQQQPQQQQQQRGESMHGRPPPGFEAVAAGTRAVGGAMGGARPKAPIAAPDQMMRQVNEWAENRAARMAAVEQQRQQQLQQQMLQELSITDADQWSNETMRSSTTTLGGGESQVGGDTPSMMAYSDVAINRAPSTQPKYAAAAAARQGSTPTPTPPVRQSPPSQQHQQQQQLHDESMGATASAIASGGGASENRRQRRQRHDSGESLMTTATTIEYPEDAPILLPSQMPPMVKIPRGFWEIVYGILRDTKGQWMDVRQFQTEYARRVKKPLSAEFLLKTCGIRSYKQLFIDIPHIDVMHSPDEVMFVRLMPPNLTRKNSSMYDVKPRYRSCRPQTHGGVSMPLEMIEALEREQKLYLPHTPAFTSASAKDPLYQASLIPDDLRYQIYNLLWNYFRHGTDISTFAESFTKRYGSSVNTHSVCGMSLDKALYYMGDLVDVGKATSDGKTWLRPVPYDRLKRMYLEQKEMERDDREAMGGGAGDTATGGGGGHGRYEEEPEDDLYGGGVFPRSNK